MQYIWRYLRKHPKLLFLDFLGAFFFVLVNLGLPTILARMVDEAILPHDVSRLYYWSVIMFLVILAGVAGRILLSYTASKLTTEMIREMRNDLYDKIQQFSHHEYEQIGISSLVTRITSDAFALMQFADQSLRLGMITPCMIASSMVMILVTSPSLAWLILLAVPPLAISIWFLARRSTPLSKQQQKTLDKINQYARENLSGLRVIRAFAREDFQEERFDEQNQSYTETSSRLFKLMGWANPLFVHILIWMIVAIVWFALEPIAQGSLQVGNLVAFVEYAFHALFSFMLFANLFMMYPRTAVSAARLQEVMDLPISIDPNPKGVTETETRGYLSFENVTFAYPGETESPVLHNISFEVKPGQTIAFIGSTGSGKSSLVQLIPRLYDVEAGAVKVGGQDVRDYDLDSLRRQVAMVLQTNVLFSGTIKENMRWGKKDATDAEIEAACKLAQAHEFISEFKDGYDTMIERGGANVSGGQRQRLCIARALLMNPKILILDDSTSAVDTKTDSLIRQGLASSLKETTKLIIGQRISSIQEADRIVVLNDGKIDAIGNHEQLLASNAIYQEVYQMQTQGKEAASDGE